MTILIIDGQGGRVGAQLVQALRKAGIASPHRLLAVGTNTMATAAMLHAGADQGATGENPVSVACKEADVVCGPMGILLADAMLGEITPDMVLSIGRCRATKVLLPMDRCGAIIAGMEPMPLARLVEEAAAQIAGMIQ